MQKTLFRLQSVGCARAWSQVFGDSVRHIVPAIFWRNTFVCRGLPHSQLSCHKHNCLQQIAAWAMSYGRPCDNLCVQHVRCLLTIALLLSVGRNCGGMEASAKNFTQSYGQIIMPGHGRLGDWSCRLCSTLLLGHPTCVPLSFSTRQHATRSLSYQFPFQTLALVFDSTSTDRSQSVIANWNGILQLHWRDGYRWVQEYRRVTPIVQRTASTHG